jgi:dihydrodipicolinate synthase/N-acetylneuraminate lyase
MIEQALLLHPMKTETKMLSWFKTMKKNLTLQAILYDRDLITTVALSGEIVNPLVQAFTKLCKK